MSQILTYCGKKEGNVRQGKEAHLKGNPKGENGEWSQGETQSPACEGSPTKSPEKRRELQGKPKSQKISAEEIKNKFGNGRTCTVERSYLKEA